MGAENLNIPQTMGMKPDELVFTSEEVKEVVAPPTLRLVSEHHPIMKEVMPEYDWSQPYEERKAFSEAMIKAMQSTGGIGLSACQVGHKVRMFVMDRIDMPKGFRKETLVCYNPKIIEASETKVPLREGCLSFPGLALQIKRSEMVKVQFYDEEENEIVLDLAGMDAKVFQHELDHMNGILFTSKVSREMLDHERRKQRKLLKKYKKFYKMIA